ncbi:J domain-containing protein [Duganella aceris]|uniref:J domain-containing protein n=1 Tax=Duganella aceris TaxID=2703883 RepID=A0ABX0FSG3_9BURK|nr:J domain-containing protein [Duganella aceris]NGZ87612.1 J domain-containing protein [Duganella aceris]
MAKIHTHYDNLKVSRMAPQEVIRAAYKALSQKYHPDKNPGDEKAARIMAILNSAYDTLSDTQRRKEHDEWIAAEEWEIEWLESTRHEDGQRGDKHRHDGPDRAWHPEHVDDAPRRPRPGRDWRWWGGLAACLALGWAAGVTMMNEPRMLSMVTAAWGGKTGIDANAAQPARGGARDEAQPDPRPDPKSALRDGWAASRADADAKPAPVKVVTLSQVVLPNAGAECDSETQTLVAPNGEPWPTQSGYIEGFPVGNRGDDMALTLDNAGNASAVFIKVYDMDRHSNVRYAFVQAHDKLLVDKLINGKYEIRYQNLNAGANPAGCGGANRTAAAGAEAGATPASN